MLTLQSSPISAAEVPIQSGILSPEQRRIAVALGAALFAKLAQIEDATMSFSDLSLRELEKFESFVKSSPEIFVKNEDAADFAMLAVDALKEKRAERRKRWIMYGGGAAGLGSLHRE